MKFNLQSLYGWYSKIIRNPKYRWWVILGTLVYLVSPFDISPDFLPFVGEVDDLLLVSVMISEVSQMIMDGVKKKKGKEDIVDEANTTQTTAKTVDVDAVSVE